MVSPSLYQAMKFRAGEWVAACFLLGLMGCHPSASPAPVFLDPDRVNGAAALEELRTLAAIRPRDAGTPGARKAADYLLGRLQAMNIQASLDAFEETCPGGPVVFYNVIGVIPGKTDNGGSNTNVFNGLILDRVPLPWRERARVRGKAVSRLVPPLPQPSPIKGEGIIRQMISGTGSGWIVLGSHYDTKAGIAEPFEGANDSASSSGLLLELARLIKTDGPLPFNILIAFFDGEECRQEYGPHDGLHGSLHLAKTLLDDGRSGNVRAVIILDMVGDRNLSVTLPRNGTPWLMTAVFRAAEAEGVRDKFSLYATELLDDHQPFLEAGMPAVDIIDFEYGSAPGKNDYWHTPADTMDKLSAESLATVGRVVVRILNELADKSAAWPANK